MISALITLGNRQLAKHPKSLHKLIASIVDKLDKKMFKFVRSTKCKDDVYKNLRGHGIEVYTKTLSNPKYRFRRVI